MSDEKGERGGERVSLPLNSDPKKKELQGRKRPSNRLPWCRSRNTEHKRKSAAVHSTIKPAIPRAAGARVGGEEVIRGESVGEGNSKLQGLSVRPTNGDKTDAREVRAKPQVSQGGG